MQIDIANLTPEAHEALIECLRIAARRGRLLRQAREQNQATACAQSLQTEKPDETNKSLSLADQLDLMNDTKQNKSKSDSS